MKKNLFYIATAALALVSCNEEELVQVPVNQANGVLTATFEHDATTRMHIDAANSNALTWSEGDMIIVFDKNDIGHLYTLQEGAGSANATFVTEDVFTEEIIGASFHHDVGHSNNTLGGFQLNCWDLDQKIPGMCDLPMWGKVTNGGKIEFKHLAGVLKVNLTNIPAGYKRLIVETSNAIRGNFFTADTSVEYPVLSGSSDSEAMKKVNIDFTESSGEANNAVLYLPLPVGEYEFINVSISDGESTMMLKSWTDKTVERAKVYSTSADISTYVTTADELNSAVTNENITTINLGGDISMSEILTINRAVTLNGNGHTLTSSATRAINIETDGEVMVKNLIVTASGERAFNVINKPAKLTLTNVTATAKNYAVMVATSAGQNVDRYENAAKLTVNNSDLTGLNVVNIAGAYTEVAITNTNLTCNDQSDKESYAAISVYNTGNDVIVRVNGGTITVNGDSYAAFNIANNVLIALDNPTFNGTSEYREDIEIGSCYITYANQTAYGFISLEDALEYAKSGETIVLANDVEISANTEIPAGVTLDGADKSISTNEVAGTSGKGKGVFHLAGGTIKNVNFTSRNTQYDIIVTASGSVIEGCKFETASEVWTSVDGETTYGKRAIFTGGTEDLTGNLTVENCTFDDQVYAFNFSNAKNQMAITFEGCTLGGWLSGHGASHTFNECTFTTSGDYANYIPYCPATFNNCIFNEGFTISLRHGSTYAFDNCTYNENHVGSPSDLKWDFSGDGNDNGTGETVEIANYDHTWTNSVGASTGEEEATPEWIESGNQGYVPE